MKPSKDYRIAKIAYMALMEIILWERKNQTNNDRSLILRIIAICFRILDWFVVYSQTCQCDYRYQAVTCIERSHFPCPVIENSILIGPLVCGHLS